MTSSKDKAPSLFQRFRKLFAGCIPKKTNNLKKGDRICDDEFLLRRVYRNDRRFIKPDGTLNSRAFAPRPQDNGKLSVDIESLIKNYEVAILDNKKFCLYKIKAEIPHSINLSCNYDPLNIKEHGKDNAAHALVTGFLEDDDSHAATLARKATRLPYPMG